MHHGLESESTIDTILLSNWEENILVCESSMYFMSGMRLYIVCIWMRLIITR